MTILQYYYTSFINRDTGSAGFQVKAMSRDIRPDMQAMIARLMAYRIPPGLNERAILTHPIALRYYPLNAQECLLMCSQSNGNDPNGRPGNFFAHVLATDPAMFTTIPPIFYWKSDFWLKEDKQTRTELEQLTDLGDPALDFDEMWRFLQRDGRLNNLFKLMCAVIDGASSRRRIIIIDTDEHVALWVAAMSCMLPPAYRPLLSFTTYHHDPYQSQFFITATPAEAQFRLSPSDYEAYFVLNMHEDKVSKVAESLYAKLVYQFGTPDRYDPGMLDFFSRYACRFPHPTAIDDQLNLMALYAWIMNEESSVELTEIKRRAILQVLPTFEQLKNYTSEDINDLKHLRDFLWRAYKAADHVDAQNIQERIDKLLNEHKVPTEDFLAEQITHHTSQLFKDKISHTWEYERSRLKRLYQEYGEDIFTNQMNLPAYLSNLTKQALQAQPDYLIRVWVCIGPYLLPEPPCLRLFARSIWAYGILIEKTASDQARDLFMAMRKAIQKREQAWLKLLVSGIAQRSVVLEYGHLNAFYCVLMHALSLEEREPYRTLIRTIQPDIIEIEFLYELSVADLEKKLPELLKWIVYTTAHPQLCDPAILVAKGLPLLRKQCNDQQWRVIARQCLSEDKLCPLLREEEAQLVKEAFSDIALDQFDTRYISLYQRYHTHPALPGGSRVIMSAMVAMQQRHLNHQLARDLCNYLSSLSLERYETEVRSFCNVFFTAVLNDQEHFLLIYALFVWQYEGIFWAVYWEHLCLQRPEALNQHLAFWFSLHPLELPQRYMTQYFLLTLQQSLETFQIAPDFQKALSTLKEQPWYVAVQESNLVRRNALLTKGQDLMKQVQRHLPNQKASEEAQQEKRQFRVEMKELFVPGKMREMHLGTLMNIYQKWQPEQFWVAYKEGFIQLLLTNNVQPILELLSFWFDDASFEALGQGPYIAQSFFIGLPQVFDLARKEHEVPFRKASQLIRNYATQIKSMGWYSLVDSFLAEVNTVEQKHRWFKR